MLTQNLVKTTKDCEGVDQAQFQSAVRSLLYRTIITRPDITYAVSKVAGFVSTLANDIEFCYQNMHYLKGTLSMGLLFKRDGSKVLDTQMLSGLETQMTANQRRGICSRSVVP